MMSSWTETRQLARIAQLYHEDKLTQQEIADRLGVSRPTVSRLLIESEREGIVRVIIDPHALSAVHLENALVRQFARHGLREAIVVPVATDTSSDASHLIRRQLGAAAAAYLDTALQEGDIIGVAWGRTLNEVASALFERPRPSGPHAARRARRQVSVVQLMGGMGHLALGLSADELARRFAEALGAATCYMLRAPGIVDRPETRDRLLQEKDVERALDAIRRATIALTGIGATAAPDPFIVEVGSLTPDEMRRLHAAGAVGDICGRFFNRHGHAIQSDLSQRVLGVELEQLRQMERVIAVAGGVERAEAIGGALRGGVVNVLITDEATAEALLTQGEAAER